MHFLQEPEQEQQHHYCCQRHHHHDYDYNNEIMHNVAPNIYNEMKKTKYLYKNGKNMQPCTAAVEVNM